MWLRGGVALLAVTARGGGGDDVVMSYLFGHERDTTPPPRHSTYLFTHTHKRTLLLVAAPAAHSCIIMRRLITPSNNCVFCSLSAVLPAYVSKGGAIYNMGTITMIQDCAFDTNTAVRGGGYCGGVVLLWL